MRRIIGPRLFRRTLLQWQACISFTVFVLTIGLIITLPWWLLQMLRLGKYRAGLPERLGMVPARLRLSSDAPEAALPVAWIHAVSVGEALAVAPLVEELRGRGMRVVISTTTHTGQRLARQRFGEENVFYFPLDLPFCIGPYLRALKPKLVCWRRPSCGRTSCGWRARAVRGWPW